MENPIGFRFYVEKHSSWDEIKMKRVEHHFKTFRLGQLYSSHAAEEFTIRYISLSRIFRKSGPIELKNQLIDFAESSESAHLNSWQSAMYRSLANSAWFCNEGLKE